MDGLNKAPSTSVVVALLLAALKFALILKNVSLPSLLLGSYAFTPPAK
jgi:hypothetical protein